MNLKKSSGGGQFLVKQLESPTHFASAFGEKIGVFFPISLQKANDISHQTKIHC